GDSGGLRRDIFRGGIRKSAGGSADVESHWSVSGSDDLIRRWICVLTRLGLALVKSGGSGRLVRVRRSSVAIAHMLLLPCSPERRHSGSRDRSAGAVIPNHRIVQLFVDVNAILFDTDPHV